MSSIDWQAGDNTVTADLDNASGKYAFSQLKKFGVDSRLVKSHISRPAVSEKRLSLTTNGNIRYQLKTPYRESLPHERSECFGYDTTHVIFEPLDFMARLAAPDLLVEIDIIAAV